MPKSVPGSTSVICWHFAGVVTADRAEGTLAGNFRRREYAGSVKTVVRVVRYIFGSQVFLQTNFAARCHQQSHLKAKQPVSKVDPLEYELRIFERRLRVLFALLSENYISIAGSDPVEHGEGE